MKLQILKQGCYVVISIITLVELIKKQQKTKKYTRK